MKCGYFQFEEFTNPYRMMYTCKKYSLISGTEKNLCDGCVIVHGEPCIPDFEEMIDELEESDEDE